MWKRHGICGRKMGESDVEVLPHSEPERTTNLFDAGRRGTGEGGWKVAFRDRQAAASAAAPAFIDGGWTSPVRTTSRKCVERVGFSPRRKSNPRTLRRKNNSQTLRRKSEQKGRCGHDFEPAETALGKNGCGEHTGLAYPPYHLSVTRPRPSPHHAQALHAKEDSLSFFPI